MFVTNGGYGAVTNALGHGIPIVVAPAGEDKREVAAHVRYFKAGIDLKRERPDAAHIRTAVHEVLDESRYRYAAQAIARACTLYHPHDAIASELAAVAADTTSHATRRSDNVGTNQAPGRTNPDS